MKAIVTFKGLRVGDLYFDKSSEKSRLVSDVLFDLEIPERDISLSDVSVEVAQPWGTAFGEETEAGPPDKYKGPWSHAQFAAIADAYLRRCVGPEGRLLRVDPLADHIQVKKSSFTLRVDPVEFEIPDE